MAHTCPECGCYCTCKGDWDDIDLGHEPAGGCVHYKSPDCEHDGDDWDVLEEDEDDEDDDEELIRLPDGGLHDEKNNITHYP